VHLQSGISCACNTTNIALNEMSRDIDPETHKSMGRKRVACDWCNKRFESPESLAIHKKQTYSSEVTLVNRLTRQCMPRVQDTRDETSTDDLENVSSSADSNTIAKNGIFPTFTVVKDDIKPEYIMPFNVFNSTGASRQQDLYPPKPPKTSYLSSSSFRDSPISTLASQYVHNVSSPRSFSTAQSSVASYATAHSVQRAGHGPSSLRSIAESTAILRSYGQALPKPWEFQPLVKKVCAYILRYFASSEHVQAMTNTDHKLFKEFVQSCLSGLKHEQFDEEHDDESEHDRMGADVILADSLGIEGAAGTNTSTVPAPNQDNEAEPHDVLIQGLMKFRAASSSVKIFKLRSREERRSLRRELALHIKLHIVSVSAPLDPDSDLGPVFSSQWLKYLHDRGILLNPKDELDWSGRGQHVEYKAEEARCIPLKPRSVLGHSATAIVESVRCRRILLARKTVKCNCRMPKEQVVIEVEHLQRVQHSHIVRIVGTYTLKSTLAILLYPVADQNLEEFMDDIVNEPDRIDSEHGKEVVPTFFGCLSSAISFIHDKNVKHMDIKPKNILVRMFGDEYKVYIADFGIARSYESAAESFTDTPTSFTRAYAAPEVVLQDTRGYSADIFSLGCVFMEMLAVMASTSVINQREVLAQTRGNDYQGSTGAVLSWYRTLVEGRLFGTNSLLEQKPEDQLLIAMPKMLDLEPDQRPLAKDLKKHTAWLCCLACDDGPEPFEAADAGTT
jgi:hypothetical protein